jgi:hypothetical protein
VRRDVAPRRANLLATLGRLSLGFGFLSLSSGTRRSRRACSRRSWTRRLWLAAVRSGSAGGRRRNDYRPRRQGRSAGRGRVSDAGPVRLAISSTDSIGKQRQDAVKATGDSWAPQSARLQRKGGRIKIVKIKLRTDDSELLREINSGSPSGKTSLVAPNFGPVGVVFCLTAPPAPAENAGCFAQAFGFRA